MNSTAERRVLFLDRDGTINIDKAYLYRPQDFEWVPGILELCRAALQKGYDLVVVTNQSGIARGYYTEADYEHITAYMKEQLAAEGITLLDVLHCPLLEGPDRKPNPGLFLKARDRWGIDMAGSLSLGDKPRDAEAGERAGVGRNYVLTADRPEQHTAHGGCIPTPQALIPYL